MFHLRREEHCDFLKITYYIKISVGVNFYDDVHLNVSRC